MTTLDEIRARTKSTEYSRLSGLKVEPDPLYGVNAVLLRATADGDGYFNILGTMDGLGPAPTPVMELDDARAIVHAARDAYTLRTIVDAIRAKFENDAKQLQATSAQLSREALRPELAKADRQAACEDAERYRNYSTWADSQQRQLETIIESILNPKEDLPNE